MVDSLRILEGNKPKTPDGQLKSGNMYIWSLFLEDGEGKEKGIPGESSLPVFHHNSINNFTKRLEVFAESIWIKSQKIHLKKLRENDFVRTVCGFCAKGSNMNFAEKRKVREDSSKPYPRKSLPGVGSFVIINIGDVPKRTKNEQKKERKREKEEETNLGRELALYSPVSIFLFFPKGGLVDSSLWWHKRKKSQPTFTVEMTQVGRFLGVKNEPQFILGAYLFLADWAVVARKSEQKKINDPFLSGPLVFFCFSLCLGSSFSKSSFLFIFLSFCLV